MKRPARVPDGSTANKRPTAWQRDDAPLDAARAELLRRQLTTLEDCHALWEAALDPFALCVAVSLSDLPRWLQDGLLVALIPPTSNIFTKAWRGSNRDRMHAARAFEFLRVRTHPARDREGLDWDTADKIAHVLLRETDAAGTPAAMRKSYQRVSRALQHDPWRFWAPADHAFNGRRLAALKEVRRLIERPRPKKKPAGHRRVLR